MKVFSRAFTLREKLLLMVLCLLLLGVFYVQCVDMPVREGIAAAENERASLETELMVVEAKLERLEKMGAVDDKTIKVINHFSHNANPLQHVLEARVADLGYLVSYDGRVIEF